MVGDMQLFIKLNDCPIQGSLLDLSIIPYLDWAHQLLTAIFFQGIIHRDIKPENLLLAADSSIKLADFGLAIDTSQETPRARVGTLDYFAPEVSSPPYSSLVLSPRVP